MRCIDVAQQATQLSEGGLGALGAWRARRHLAGCARCRSYLSQLERSARALPQLVADAPGAAQEAAALQLFRQQRQAWQREPAEAAASPTLAPASVLRPVLAVLGLVVVELALARHPAAFGLAWLQMLLLTAAACSALWLSQRQEQLAVLFVALASALPAGFVAADGLQSWTGVHCLLQELISSAVILLAARARSRGPAPAGLFAIAAAGALAGDAALHVACGAVDSALHLLVFHVGGVIGSAWLVSRVALRFWPARSSTGAG